MTQAIAVAGMLGGLLTATPAAGTESLPAREQVRLRETITRLQSTTANRPGDAEAWKQLGTAYLKLEDGKAAFVALSRASALAPEDPAPRAWLIQVRASSGDPVGAARELATLAERFPASASVHVALARVRGAAGDLRGAAEAAEAAYRMAPSDPDAVMVGLKWPGKGETAPRVEAARSVVEAHRDHLELRMAYVDALLEAGKTELALPHAADLASEYPDWPAARLSLARTYGATGDLLAAAAEIEHLPQASLPPEALLLMAKARLRTRRVEEARRFLELALHKQPGFLPAQYELAGLYVRLRADTAAEELLGQLLQRNPRDYRALILMGQTFQGKGDYDRAAEQFRRAVEADGARAEAHRGLGAVALKRGQAAEAIARYTEALTRDPNHAPTHENVAQAYLAAGQMDRGLQHLQKAVRMAPLRPEAHYQLGQLLFRLGRGDEARRELKKAERLAEMKRGTLGGMNVPVIVEE